MQLRVVLVLACIAWSDAAWATDRQPQVLVLHSTRRDAQFAILSDREFPRLFGDGRGVDYYAEYLDQPRFSEPGYQAAFRDFLRQKYAAQRFDVIVAMLGNAIEFVRSNRDTLFPGTPVVFFANRAPAPMSNSTGVIAESRFMDTVDFAAVLQPDLEHVFVVTGASARDREYEANARTEFTSARRDLQFTYLSGLPTSELESRLADLPPRSMVYVIVVYQDGSGENFHPVDYTSRVASIASAPVYAWLDAMIGRGAVGGSVLSEQEEVHAIAAVVRRVLRGERAGDIPVSTPDVSVRQVDWRQLQRWGISERHLPSGTLVRFKELNVWERFRPHIIAGAAIVIAQGLLMVALLMQRRRRRAAERHVRDLGGRLLQAQEEERTRIARELHDDVSQQMALLTMEIEMVRKRRTHDRDDVADQAVERARAVAASVHDLSHRLHPARLRILGLAEALDALRGELSQHGVTIDFSHDGVPAVIPPDIALCVFRVAQEGLQNAIKHGKARHVSVRLSAQRGELVLTIVDDGIGFDVSSAWGAGLGLVSMRERLDLVDGRLHVGSEPGVGTRLLVTIPLHALEASAAAV